MRAACCKKLMDAGVPSSVLPVGIEYDVKKKCLEHAFGNPKGWYMELSVWPAAFQEAGPMNRVTLDVQEGRYVRCFVAPGVCRRLLGEQGNL